MASKTPTSRDGLSTSFFAKVAMKFPYCSRFVANDHCGTSRARLPAAKNSPPPKLPCFKPQFGPGCGMQLALNRGRHERLPTLPRIYGQDWLPVTEEENSMVSIPKHLK